MSEEPFVRVEALSHGFPVSRSILASLLSSAPRQRLRAVHEVSFSIARGRTFGLVGESGCGKSTVGRLLAGLYSADSGHIELRSKTEIRRDSGGRQPILAQMIFQDPHSSLDPRWRVSDIIAEPIRAQRLIDDPAKLRRRVAELLERVGLSPADGVKFPHEFSGGQRQRIAIARALSTNPPFLVCDEPTSALDVSVQAQILNLMKALQREFGLTYLFISHDLAVVAHMAHEVGVMYLGSIVEIASSQAIFSRPLHPYTRMLLNSAPSLQRGRSGPQEAPRGAVPNPLTPPSGCAFHPRCGFADDRCRTTPPPMAPNPDGGAVACHAVHEGRIGRTSCRSKIGRSDGLC